MPRKIREIKYHPSADLTKASVILKLVYTDILQNIKKTIRNPNYRKSLQELQKVSRSCQAELDKTIKNLKKESGLSKEHAESIEKVIESAKLLLNACESLSQFPPLSKIIDDKLKKIRYTSKPSSTFVTFIQIINEGQGTLDRMSQNIKMARQSIQDLETLLKAVKIKQRHVICVVDTLNKLIPQLKTYNGELGKLVKAIKPLRRLKVILRQANQLKEIFNEKGQI